MDYLTYAQYQLYGGTLSEVDYNRFAFRAKSELNNYTFNRITTTSECAQRCMFELVEYISENGKNGAVKSVSSVSNDGYSVSVEDTTADDDIYNIIYTYFSESDVMFRGTDDVGGYIPSPDPGYEYLQVEADDANGHILTSDPGHEYLQVEADD